MPKTPPLRRELKERFLRELTPSEKVFFLKEARKAIMLKNYRPSEDLFHYCYFLTMRRRLRSIAPEKGHGYLRFLLVEGVRDVDEAVRLYEERLQRDRLPAPDEGGKRFLEFLSS